MTFIFWWIKSWFCSHEWEREEGRKTNEYGRAYTVVSATCLKCGWHRAYRKF